MTDILDELFELVKTNNDESNNKIFQITNEIDLYEYLWPNGENLLHWACAFNNIQIIEYILVEELLHVNMENFRGTTPLIYACKNDNTEAIKILLSYNANPYIKSGFTGLRPSETVNKEENKLILEEYVNKYIPLENLKVKEGFSLYQSYKYREYMWMLSNLNYFTSKFKHIIQGFVPHKLASNIYKDGGAKALDSTLNSLLYRYYDIIDNPSTIIENECLFCENTEETKRCSKCKQVFFCNKFCQKLAHPIHKYDCEKQN